jgi:hypothetical protein
MRGPYLLLPASQQGFAAISNRSWLRQLDGIPYPLISITVSGIGDQVLTSCYDEVSGGETSVTLRAMTLLLASIPGWQLGIEDRLTTGDRL